MLCLLTLIILYIKSSENFILYLLMMWNIKIKLKLKTSERSEEICKGGNTLSQHTLISLSRPERNT